MKKIQLLVAGLATISLLSCDKAKLDIKFDAPQQTIYMTLNPADTAGSFEIKKIITIPNLEAKAKENGVNDLSKIKSVNITKITVSLDSIKAPHENFDSLVSGSLVVRANKNSTLSPLNVGSFDNIPQGATSFNITPTSENYMVFSKESEIEYTAKLKTKGKVKNKIYLKIVVDSKVTANPTN